MSHVAVEFGAAMANQYAFGLYPKETVVPASQDDRDLRSPSTLPSRTRRRVLKAAGATATVALSGLPFAAPAAQAATVEDDFAGVSRFLTGKATLDPAVQRALLQAFLGLDTAFGEKLAKLRAAIGNPNVTPTNLHDTLVARAPDLAKVPQDILLGWYLGVAGSGKHATYVTYANDLANAAVADVLSPPSYAYGPCNSWAKKPV